MHQCIGLRINQLQRIDDLCINARLEIRILRFNFHRFVVSGFARASRWLEFGDAGDIDYLCLVNQ